MTLPHSRCPRHARWFLMLAAGLPLCAALAQAPSGPDSSSDAADAAETAENDTPATGSAGSRNRSAQAAQARFDIDLQAPEEVRAFLLRHLELQRFRELGNLDASELSRLIVQAEDNLHDLLGTLGHFAPRIEIDDPDTSAGTAPLGTVRIRVDPGPVTTVATADVFFRGDIASNPAAAEQRERVQGAWSLGPGLRFTQADWDSAKTRVLRAMTTQRYPAGRIHNSLADIDPLTHTARLAVELDSGAPVRLGEIRVQGAERYGTDTATRLARLAGLTTGSDYDLARLQDAQQRIADSGYFESVFVTVEPGADGEPAPVLVQLREARRQKLVLGVGGSTDSGARVSAEHTHHRVPGIDWRAVSKLQLERSDQLVSTDWSSPVDEQGWRWIASAQAARQLDGNDTTTSQRLRAGQSQDNTELDRSFFLQYDRARSVNALDTTLGSNGAESSLSANYAWTRRRFEPLLSPESGYGLGVELGVGTTLGSERKPFVRGRARWLGYWPVGSAPVAAAPVPLGEARPATASTAAAGHGSRLALRLEGGAVWAQASAPIPETQLFLTGGDNAVRGYGLRDIGIPQSDGGVAPGRYLAVASLEWQRPIWRNSQRTAWEHVVFADAGAVADKPRELRAHWGVGTGVRYNSPVGPLQVDIAYGARSKRLRLHLNVGFTF